MSDEALENMIPPPKRKIKEDTLVAETAAPDQSYSLAHNYSYRQGDEKKKESSHEDSPKPINFHKNQDYHANNLNIDKPIASMHESPK